MDLEFVQLSISEVRNRQLIVPGANAEQMRHIHRVLQSALFQDRIPHYRPIGACIKGMVKYPSDMVTRALGVNKSYIELWRDTKDLIMAEGGGFLQEDLRRSAVEKENFAFIYAVDTATTSNNSFKFCGMGDKEARMLVRDVPVISLGEGCEVKLFLYRGTGLIDFTQARNILYRESGLNKVILRNKVVGDGGIQFVPQRAVYSLYNNLVIQPYQEEDGNVLHLTYKCDIDEDVLTRIVQGFAVDLGGQGNGSKCKDTFAG